MVSKNPMHVIVLFCNKLLSLSNGIVEYIIINRSEKNSKWLSYQFSTGIRHSLKYIAPRIAIPCLILISTFRISAQPNYVKRVNCGSASSTTYNGKDFDADTSVSGSVTFDGEKTFTAGSYLALSEPYKSIRYTKNSIMTYRFTVSNGSYNVRLHFAEPYHGVAPNTDPDTRNFNYDIEGQYSETELNIISRVGPNAVYIVDRTVTVADGELTLSFSKGSGNDPLINAIEVVWVSPNDTGSDYIRRINCGGEIDVEYENKTFTADFNISGDVEFDGERTFESNYITLSEPIKSIRYTKNATMHYRFTTPNGSYRTILYFSEPYHGLGAKYRSKC